MWLSISKQKEECVKERGIEIKEIGQVILNGEDKCRCRKLKRLNVRKVFKINGIERDKRMINTLPNQLQFYTTRCEI